MTNLTEEDVTGSSWSFYLEGNPSDARPMSFEKDGRIVPPSHSNEARWRIDDGFLILMTADSKDSSRFERASDSDGEVELQGFYLLEPALDIKFVLRKRLWGGAPKNPHRTVLHFERQIRELGWRIGDHTYGAPTIYEEQMASLHIGRFTSIAGGVVVALGNHRTDTVTTYPFGAFRHFWSSMPDTPDHSTKGNVLIGNDVWIGANVFIGSGVTIGDGAVIGASAVVTRAVPPYAIVGGNPCRILRYRFEPDQIAALQAIRWWDWPDNEVDRFLPLLTCPDINAFITAARSQPLQLVPAFEAA